MDGQISRIIFEITNIMLLVTMCSAVLLVAKFYKDQKRIEKEWEKSFNDNDHLIDMENRLRKLEQTIKKKD